MRPKCSILLISAFDAPFIDDDVELLSESFIVKKQIGSGLRAIMRIALNVARADIVFCWFASVYAAAAVLMGKVVGVPSVIVVGGVDAAKDETLGYGMWLSWWRRRLVRYVMLHGDRLLVGDHTLAEDVKRLCESGDVKTEYIPPGYDSMFWKPVGEKEPSILAVAFVDDALRLRVKGIDVLVEAARRLTDVPFVIVGVEPSVISGLRPPPNIIFHPPVPREQLLPFYQRAKVYCQPSRHEAVGYAIREAMLCGCIPVASEVGGVSSGVAGIGLLVPPGDPEALASALRQALTFRREVAAKARARIVALYSMEKREIALRHIVEALLP